MTALYFDAKIHDDARRQALYAGDLFVYSARPTTTALIEHAKAMIEAAFAPHDPRNVHEVLDREQCAAILADVKPRFIHHPESKRLLAELLIDLGCDPEQVYFDVPRLRSSYPSDYLTTGIAYAFPNHRDTWYSAPQLQLNFWLPMYEHRGDNGLSITPLYFDREVANNSDKYNYYQWNATSRGAAASQVTEETRILPAAQSAVERKADVRIVCPPGGLIIFSGSQLHASVPNSSGHARYSVDFRTVHIGDARHKLGAPNVDSHCTGHTMRDYLRISDYTNVPDDVIALYDDGTESEGVLVCEANLQNPKSIHH